LDQIDNFINTLIIWVQIESPIWQGSNLHVALVLSNFARSMASFKKGCLLQKCSKVTWISGINFINILCTHFLYKRHFGSFSLVTFWLWGEICTKNLRLKRWWNRHLVTLYQGIRCLSGILKILTWICWFDYGLKLIFNAAPDG